MNLSVTGSVPSFYFFRNNFYSTEFPVINAVFEAHLQKQVSSQPGIRQMSGALSENDRANLILRDASFRDVLAMNPGRRHNQNSVNRKG